MINFRTDKYFSVEDSEGMRIYPMGKDKKTLVEDPKSCLLVATPRSALYSYIDRVLKGGFIDSDYLIDSEIEDELKKTKEQKGNMAEAERRNVCGIKLVDNGQWYI